MRSAERPTRAASLTATVTTLAALMVMAAGAPSVRGPIGARAVQAEAMAGLGETTAVRAMAAAVAAAAYDLLARGRPAIDAATPATVPSLDPPARLAAVVPDDPPALAPGERLGERRLDLPPPGC